MHDRPWMVALEKQFAALRFVSDVIAAKATVSNGQDSAFYFQGQAFLLRRAPAFAWTHDPATAVVMASRSVPKESPLLHEHLWPDTAGWWWFDDPFTTAKTAGQGTLPVHALAWGTNGDPDAPGVLVVGFVLDDRGVPVCSIGMAWRFGMTLEEAVNQPNPDRADHTPSEGEWAIGRVLIAGLTWLQQRVCVLSTGPVERHRRKQLAREHDAPLPADVKVVELRRAESRAADTPPSEEPVEWSCRWVVSGHWRLQPYKDGRKLIFIHPFVKGPADKPLRVPSHTVYLVDR